MQDFNSLFTTYYSKMVRFAYGYVKSMEVAEDFVVDAFSSYWQKRHGLSSDTVPQAYILTIVKHKCLNHLEHVKVRLRAEEEIGRLSSWHVQTSMELLRGCDPDRLFSKEIQDIVSATLAGLSERTQAIYNMSRDKGLSYREIADELGISVKTVEYHISKALEQLRIALQDFMLLAPFLLLFI